MRRAAVFLALLRCLLWTGAQGEDGGGTGKKEGKFDIQGVKAAHDQSSSQTQMSTVFWAELKEIRDMAIEHRIKIQRLEQDNTALEARISSSEKEVEELQRENADNELLFVLQIWIESQQVRIRAQTFLSRRSQPVSLIQDLSDPSTLILDRVTASENKSTVLEAKRSSSEKEVEELQRENADFKFVQLNRMSSSEKEVEELQTENAGGVLSRSH
ncbi:hypothetical protein NQZ68_035081 [Dissostichus eleginoides]|nr:hypothetical protein NQZ68_035081 [Dissostichus eleginoides]